MANVISRVTVLNMATGANLPPPHCAKQETETERHGQRRVGTVLDRLVDRLDELVRDLAHGVDRLAAFVLGVGNDIIYTGPGALPRRTASVSDDVGDLLSKPREIVTQSLQILLHVAGSRGGGFADVA